MKLFALAFVASGCLLMAQGAGQGLSGPTLGFAPGATPAQLQPILGIPGAARLGDPISLPNTVTQVYVAPGHRYALASQGAAGATAVVVLRNGSGIVANPVLTPLAHAMAAPDLVAFSPTGQSSVLYSQAFNRLQVFTGFPNAPRLAQDIPNFQVPTVRLLAVSDDAQLLLAADATSAVYALSQAAAAVPVYYSNQISALAFVPGSHEAILCDLALGTAAVLQPLTGAARLLIAADDACRPRAAGVTSDGNTILLACSFAGYVWSVDRESGFIRSYQVPSMLDRLDNLGNAGAFLLSPPDHGLYWMLSWHGDSAVVSFIGAHVQGPGN
jgi:hypothetical protein